MLSIEEKVLFSVLATVCLAYAGAGVIAVSRAIRRGRQAHLGDGWLRRAITTIFLVFTSRTLLKVRRPIALFHSFILFAFSYYALVNLVDLAEGFTGFSTLRAGGVWNVYNAVADVLSALALIGMTFFLVRRFVFKPRSFAFNDNIMLLEGVKEGIRRDSAIVGGFILLHVGSRWVGQAFRLAREGPDPWQPTANWVANQLAGVNPTALEWGIHVTWWLALGLILLFLPYFPRSKHIHLFFAPLNLTLRPPALQRLPAPSDGSGPAVARQLEDLPWPRLLDAYACIMCNRCQDACPAYNAGQPLSPAALEINKRYYLNRHLREFSRGAPTPPMWDYAIAKEGIWACTTCSACVEVCPVGNAPMLDIVALRQALLEDGEVPDPGLQDALLKLSKYGNSFGKPDRQRGQWTKSLPFPVKDARRAPVEVLWFVGDFASFDPRVQEISRGIATILHRAGVDFGILFEAERNAGNDIRRVGEEGLFQMLAEHNIEALDSIKPKLIVTSDPHSLNALRNEYRTFGKGYRVVHYTELIYDLIVQGKLPIVKALGLKVTYHDPCYLARYCRITHAPRQILAAIGAQLIEMPHHGTNTFCCGAGGGRIWMRDAPGQVRPSELRIREALALDVNTFVVACPKDYVMFTDAVKSSGNHGRLVVKDIAELVQQAAGISVEEVAIA